MNRKLLQFKNTASNTSIIVLIFVFLCMIGCQQDDNQSGWRTYRHNNSRTAVSPEIISSPLSLKWSYIPLHPPHPVWNLPAEEMKRIHPDDTYHVSAANGIAYFGSSVNNKVYALDLLSGKEKWTFFTEGPVRFSPVIWNNRIYFGSDDGNVYCLNARNGRMIWKYHPGPFNTKLIGNERMVSLWPIRTSVLIKDGVLYFGAGVFPYDGLYICALNAKNGELIWKNDELGDAFDLQYGGVSPQGYLIASNTKLIVPSGRAMPATFNLENGEFLHYLRPSGKHGGVWGMLDDGELIAGTDRSGIPVKVSYDIESDTLIEDVYASFLDLDMASTDSIFYIITPKGIYAVDRFNSSEIQEKIDKNFKEQREILAQFRQRTRQSSFDAESVDSIEKQLNEMNNLLDPLVQEKEALNALLSKWFFSKDGLESIIVTRNQIIAGGKDFVVGVDRETGEQLWQGEVEGVAKGLSVSDQHLIVSTDKGHIYCFGAKPEDDEPVKIEETASQSPYPEKNLTSPYYEAVKTIIKESAIEKGYCLVLDCGKGELVYELAKMTDLNIIGIDSDKKKTEEGKKILDKAGLYGSRVVLENWPVNSLPDYFADIIICGEEVKSTPATYPAGEIFRVLRPGGGMALFGQPSDENRPEGKTFDFNELDEEWGNFETTNTEIKGENGNWVKITREYLPGAGSWTHQYGNPANTCCSDDQLVMAPFTTLWYGSPGPQMIPERHARSTAPLAFKGKLFIPGEDIISAYNSYNGTLLWTRHIDGATRVRVDADGGNIAVNDQGLFLVVKDKCLQFDTGTGKTINTFELPSELNGGNRRWGYLSVKDNILFGSAARPLDQDYASVIDKLFDENLNWKEQEDISPTDALLAEYYKFNYPEEDDALSAFQRDGTKWRFITDFPDWSPGIRGVNNPSERMLSSDGVFAINIESGDVLWTHKGDMIGNLTISVGDKEIYFADNTVTYDQKLKGYREKQTNVRNGKWEEFDIELNLNEADVRMVYSLDIYTGKKNWNRAVDLSGCGDDMTALACQNDVLVFFGSYGLHDKWRFPAGELKWHRVTALSAPNGDMMWSRPLNYMVRPLLINDEIIIEPRKCNLYTGEIIDRVHPVTKELVPWEFYRPGHNCAATAANDNCLFYRSYNSAYYDLKEDKGLSYYGAIRPGCWINIIPGDGLVLSPESSSGCTCSFPLRTSVVLKPVKPQKVEEWSMYISNSPLTPVRHLAINLGAPGDKKDNNGTIWFGYPRKKIASVLQFNINEQIKEGMGFYSYDSKDIRIDGTESPWLYTNGCIGLEKCTIPLIDKLFNEDAGTYTVRLGFLAPSTNRTFDIKIQNDIVLQNVDILKETGALNRTVVKEFKEVKVADSLSIELIAENITDPDINQAPVINFIEIIREDALPSTESAGKGFSLTVDEAQKLLSQASKEQINNNFSSALDYYHKVLKGTTQKQLKILALKGMEEIADRKSLPEIKNYCYNYNPIIWDYKEPDQEIVDAAVNVYKAVARKISEEDKGVAEKMLSQSFVL